MNRKKLIGVLIPVLIVLAGLAALGAFIAGRPEQKTQEKKETSALVKVYKVKAADRKVVVYGTGTVSADREVSVIPQVSGRIVHMAKSFVAGGFFKKDDLLFQIEDIDYVLAREKAKAAKARAEYELAREESNARIARAEWERMAKGNENVEPNPLVLHAPQLENAKAALSSAIADVALAELNLKRTKLYAPFNCTVRSEGLDIGQMVRAGTQVAVLTGTDTVEIIVPLPISELKWINIPRLAGEKGWEAELLINVGDTAYRWKGYVTRSLGEVDPKSRMAHVAVVVKDPYGLDGKTNGHPDLAPGTFAEVRIFGHTLGGVKSIPREALRDDSTVWVMDGDGRLKIRKVRVPRTELKEVFIEKGLEDGETVVLTTFSGAVEGMKLRVAAEGQL